jgi:hypothetical protein
MSPHHFANIRKQSLRQSERERHIEEQVEHAVSFAFSPVTRTFKQLTQSRRFFRRGRQSGNKE